MNHHLSRELVKWARTLHIYISLVGFLMFGFFAITGIILNHDSFGWDQMSTAEAKARIPENIAKSGDQAAIVNALRTAIPTTLPATRFSGRGDDIEVNFTGPARHTQARVNRATGEVELTVETRGWAGVLADLHKGAETGAAWKFLLDFISVLMVLSSITGAVMLFWLPKRLKWGLLALAAGTVGAAVCYVVMVPK